MVEDASMETLATLESFVQSAESGSFSKAARKLALTPAAVSKNVAKLESNLGVRLFQRSTRSLRLTEPGERFWRDLSGGLSTIKNALANLADGTHEPAGTLRVSVTAPFAKDYIFPMLGAYLEACPNVSIDWHLANRTVELVGEGFDAAIGAGFDIPGGLTARELARAHLVAVASPAYLSTHQAPSKPTDLSSHDGILMRSLQTGRIRSWTFRSEGGEEAAFDLKPKIVLDDMDGVCSATLCGLGIGIIAMPHVARHLASGELVRVLRNWHADGGPISIYYSAAKHIPRKTRLFVDHVTAHFKRARIAHSLSAG